MDGLTKVQTCRRPVNAGQTNTLKIAIADASDRARDSWVFISGCVTVGGAAACLAKRAAPGDFYTFGAKGWDYGGECKGNCDSPDQVAGENMYLVAQQVRTGLYYDYWDADIKGLARGRGVDCSGLILWSYAKATARTTHPGNTRNPGNGVVVIYEGADGQFNSNTDTASLTRQQLRPGDLLFFDTDSSVPQHMDHVAMFVGHNEVVEAFDTTSGIIRRSLDASLQTKGFVAFRRVKEARVPWRVEALSPVDLIVTDPEGFTIDASTLLRTAREVLREVPRQLCYSEADVNDDGDLDDVVYGPRLKDGDYVIKVVPEARASQGDVYSLLFSTDAGTVVLAENVTVGDIPSQGYGIRSTGGPVTTYVPLVLDVTPGGDPDSWACSNSMGVLPVAVLSTNTFAATTLDAQSVRFGRVGNEAAEVHQDKAGNAQRHVEDVNNDGLPDMVFHFRFGETSFGCNDVPEGERSRDVTTRLSGRSVGGDAFTGTGALRLVR